MTRAALVAIVSRILFCRVLALVLAIGMLACSPSDPGLIHWPLSAEYRPGIVNAGLMHLPESVGLVNTQEGPWLRTVLKREDWVRSDLPGVWQARREVRGNGRPVAGSAQRILPEKSSDASIAGTSAEVSPYRFTPINFSNPGSVTIEPGDFCAFGDWVYLCLAAETSPPAEDLVLLEYLDRGFDDGTTWRLALDEVEAEAIPLFGGESARLELDPIPQGMSLSFWCAARSLATGLAFGATKEMVRLRVWLDGQELHTTDLPLQPEVELASVQIPLPESQAAGDLVFELDGGSALGAIFQPRIHRTQLGTYGERPWACTQPDLALVIVDTYRADNLEAYGGDPRIAPELNALAKRGRIFENAWATSPWTLPSHASLFSGLLPPAADCMTFDDRLSDRATTLAETLRRAGYRTVAVTDHGLVSRDHGLSQGFEWFQEVHRRGTGSLSEALADVRAQLAVDDGRPLFLFFQTYRAHVPYEVTDATRAELMDLFPSERSYLELTREMPIETIAAGKLRAQEFLAAMHGLYRGASRDTSRGIGTLYEDLDRADLLRNGHLFIASDHGEAFGEHALLGHGSTVFEAQIRIPLIHLGAGVDPGRVSTPVSLLDLPPTLARLAGSAAPEDWMGTDLGLASDQRSLFAFVGNQPTTGHSGAFAARRADHKLYFTDAGIVTPPHAYALDRDPAEGTDVYSTEPWASPFAAEVRAALPALLEPRYGAVAVQRSAEAQDHLRRLGYLTSDSDS